MKKIAISAFALMALVAVVGGIYYMQTWENDARRENKKSTAKSRTASSEESKKIEPQPTVETSDLEVMGKELDAQLNQFSSDVADIETMGADDALAEFENDLGAVLE